MSIKTKNINGLIFISTIIELNDYVNDIFCFIGLAFIKKKRKRACCIVMLFFKIKL